MTTVRAAQGISNTTNAVRNRSRLSLHDAASDARGHGAAVAQHQRDEGFAVQADFVHGVVHEEGGAGQVAAVFQQRKNHVERHDVRQGDGYARGDSAN